MFEIDQHSVIHATRGDIGSVTVSIPLSEYVNYTFKAGDILRFRVVEKNCCSNVALSKDFIVGENTEFVDLIFSGDDTKIGPLISRPVDYWYEIELNPNTTPQTIIGYDKNGPKVFRLYPEGDDK